MSSSKHGVRRFTRTDAGTRDRLILSYLEKLDTPRALAVALCYKYNAHHELLSFPDVDFNSIVIHGLRKISADYQATRLLSKCRFLKLDIDRRAVALEKERSAESQCRLTNAFFKGNSPELHALRESLAYRKIKRFIAEILGVLHNPAFIGFDSEGKSIGGHPPGFLNQVDAGHWDPGWTPGRNTVSFGSRLSSAEKFSEKIECTAAAAGFVLRTIQRSHQWGRSVLAAEGPCSLLFRALNIVDGNVLTVVPKNAKTDRVICYEPNGNIWVQKIFGDYIRSRLKRFGCNLHDQTINAELARVGSIDGSLSTIDLSSASDTLATEVIYELLPFEWASLLDKLRSRVTIIDSVPRKNEKFSSMGNGFTFELESMIFLAISKAFSSNVSVYGDDIIVPSNRATSVMEYLRIFGFTPNPAKSFYTGVFRESCGHDYILGYLVTPIYIRHDNAGWSVSIHNQLRTRLGSVTSEEEYRYLVSWRVEQFPLGPSGYGDGHYHSNLDEASPQRATHGLEGWWFRSVMKLYSISLRAQDKNGAFTLPGVLTAAVGPKAPLSMSQSILNRRSVVYKKTRTLASSWPEVLVV